jgi:broad specificity phosphatase PhoE
MVTLALVRHGETVGNSSIRYYGRTDVDSFMQQTRVRSSNNF